MLIKGNWSVSSAAEKTEDNSLKGLIGQYGLTVDVKISSPYNYSRGPFE